MDYKLAFKQDLNCTVSAYIYSKNTTNKKIYFGFVRKLYKHGRIKRNLQSNTGAAGTDPKYHGKWTSIGGSQNSQSKHFLHGIIKEFNDEANIKLSYRRDVQFNTKGSILNCKLVTKINNNILFLFEMNPKYFFKVFPIYGITNQKILLSSHGMEK
jgi:hypothetical protein